MKIHYKEDENRIVVDGKNTIFLTKNDYAFHLNGDDEVSFDVRNHYYALVNSLTFKERLITTWEVLKFLWGFKVYDKFYGKR